MLRYPLATILALMIVSDYAKSSDSSSGGSNNVDDDRCNHVTVNNSSWITDSAKTILYWIVKSQTKPTPACQCPSNGTLNDVARLQTINGSYPLCTGCSTIGNEVVATDTKFCTDPYVTSNGLSCKSTFGPCTGVTVYRCACRQPTTKVAASPPKTRAPTAPVATTTGYWR